MPNIRFTGGLFSFSSERGFISDDVANYEVVLANGDIVNANATENSDLFKAIKGGGNNFGIITRIDFPTFPLGDFWGGKAFYPVSSYENQIDALVAYLNRPNPDPKLHVFVHAGFTSWFPGSDRAAMNDVFYLEPRQGDAATPFANPEHTFHSTFSVGSLEKFSNEQASAYETNVRYDDYCMVIQKAPLTLCRMIYMTTTLKAYAGILKKSWRRFENVGEATKDIEGFTFSIGYEPFPASLMKQSAEKGGNNLGLDSSDSLLVLVLLYGGWKHAKDDERVLAESQKLLQEINKEAEAQRKSHPYRFMNYSFSNEDPIVSYGPKQKQFLLDVSAKYDKEGFFQKKVGFKLNGFR